MKITKQQLKRIIKEELAKIIENEDWSLPHESTGAFPVPPGDVSAGEAALGRIKAAISAEMDRLPQDKSQDLIDWLIDQAQKIESGEEHDGENLHRRTVSAHHR